MSLFRYVALSESGSKVEGWLDAENFEEAKLQLKKKSIWVTKIFPVTEKGKSLSKSEQMLLFQDLSKLLQAGLPLYETLLSLEEKYRGSPPHFLILDISTKVKGGSSFSQALSAYPKSFDPLFCSLIANAEVVGCLESALEEIAEMLSRQMSLKKQIVSTLLYPGILLAFCFIVMGALLFFVIPSLHDLFEGRSVHPLTRFILSMSQGLSERKGFLGMSILSVGILFFLSLQSSLVKEKLWHFFLKLPVVKPIMVRVAWVRFSRAFATLLKGGVPYVNALNLASRVMNHPPLFQELQKAEKRILDGGKLSEFLQMNPWVPGFIPRMISIAEQGGNLPQMLQRIASFYEEELTRTLSRLTVMLQPILLLILGVIVGGVVLSVLLPLTDVSSFMSE